MKRIFILILFPLCIAFSESRADITLNGVVASIDGVPLTVGDVSKRLGRGVTLSQCATDPDARSLIDTMIKEMLIESEAQSKRISVSKEDIEGYINEVASRNNLSREQFEAALKNQKKELSNYKEEIKTEILKARLVSTYIQGSTGVSDQEIDSYLKQNGSRSSSAEKKSGTMVTLRQIVLSKDKHTIEEAKSSLLEVKRRLEEGDDFEDLATEISEGAEAEDGGLLGKVSLNELSPEVFNAVLSLEEEQTSGFTETASGYHLFYVDSKEEVSEDENEEPKFSAEERNAARQMLEQAKFQQKADRFFAEELYKTHSVDKKI